METKKTANKQATPNATTNIIKCIHMGTSYRMVDVARDITVCEVSIASKADDRVNSRFRDALVAALYQYGRQSTKKEIPSNATKFISCERVNGGYAYYERKQGRRGGLIAYVCVVAAVDDVANTQLRDAVLCAAYEYWRGLKYWP